MIHDELSLDGSPLLNLASFVHTWMPAEADKLMMENVGKNLIDQDEYPMTRRSPVLRDMAAPNNFGSYQKSSMSAAFPFSLTYGMHPPPTRLSERPLLVLRKPSNWVVSL
jgi:hypothetical protein